MARSSKGGVTIIFLRLKPKFFNMSLVSTGPMPSHTIPLF